MNFTIITHVDHVCKDGKFYGYAPYVREMNIWLKYVDKVIVVGPISNRKITAIDIPYEHSNVEFVEVPSFSINSLSNSLRTFFLLPLLIWKVFGAMKRADHVHLRCPGNMGLIGAIIQIFFPKKIKTAKYAGNWDPTSAQPFTYRLQKDILSNTFWTKNMNVLVYGKWDGASKNIKTFFTATYREEDKKEVLSKSLSGVIDFLFVGTLSEGKRPLYVLQLVSKLKEVGCKVRLRFYGEGAMKENLQKEIEKQNLQDSVTLMGNRAKEEVEQAFIESHFLVLPSKSEGWPKVVAEAMFWGCVPLVTSVSCVPYMVGNGSRGILLTLSEKEDIKRIMEIIDSETVFKSMMDNGVDWSRKYTLDYFEDEIKQLL